jgi:hypothetical protein
MGKGKRKYEPEKRKLMNLISLVRRFRKNPFGSQEVFERLQEYNKGLVNMFNNPRQNQVMEYIITGQNYNINTNTVKSTLNYMIGDFSKISKNYKLFKAYKTRPGDNVFYAFTQNIRSS